MRTNLRTESQVRRPYTQLLAFLFLCTSAFFPVQAIRASQGEGDPAISQEADGCDTCLEKVEITYTPEGSKKQCWEERDDGLQTESFYIWCETFWTKHTFSPSEWCELGQECTRKDYDTYTIACPECPADRPWWDDNVLDMFHFGLVTPSGFVPTGEWLYDAESGQNSCNISLEH